MIVTIWRHGEAGEAFADRRRELTDSGRDDISFGCQQFHLACAGRNMPAPDLILHSPWVRTRQTAELIASAFARKRVGPNWWAHLGLTGVMLGDGKKETEYSDGSPTFDLL